MTTVNKQRRRTFGWTILYLASGIGFMLLLYVTISTNHLTSEIRHTQKNSASTLTVIEDCTQPTGQCFKDGQTRTAKAVTDISEATTKASIYAAYCVQGNQDQTVAQIEECVKRQFALHAKD